MIEAGVCLSRPATTGAKRYLNDMGAPVRVLYKAACAGRD
jgi:hypothetical protein